MRFGLSLSKRFQDQYTRLRSYIDANRSEHSTYAATTAEDSALLLVVVWISFGLVTGLFVYHSLSKKERHHKDVMPDFDLLLPRVGFGVEFEQPVVPGPVLVKYIEAGTAARRSKRVRVGDTVHSIQGELCDGKTLKEMEDYILGEPLSEVTLALLKPGAAHTALQEPLASISEWVKRVRV